VSLLRRMSIPVVILGIALLAACASNKPSSSSSSSAPTPPPEPVKSQEATPLERARIKTDLGAGYYERGQFDVAIEVLNEAQALDPNYPKIYDIFGLVYTMLGETQKAESSFRRALSLAPNDSEIRANWGAFLCTTGRTRESIPEFDAAIADPLFKKPEVAMINAGKCMAALGDNKKADEYLRRAMAVSPGNPTAAYQLALLAYRETRFDDARSWMRPVMQQGNPRPEALLLGMCIERKKGDRQAELSYTSQLRNRYPESDEARAISSSGACE
jgi:type IV pilus assembly protein PilF